jgi:hypothetical protein
MDTGLPLLELELQRRGRKWMTYLIRVIAPGIAALVLGISSLVFLSAKFPTSEIANGMAITLAAISFTFNAFVVAIVTPMYTSGSIAAERESHSLELLMLADRRGMGVYFTKLTSAFVQSELLILSVLPVMSISTLLGGVSFEALMYQFVAWTVLNLAVTVFGLFTSTIAATSIRAFRDTLGVLILATICNLGLWIYRFSSSFAGGSGIPRWLCGPIDMLDATRWEAPDPYKYYPGIVICLITILIFGPITMRIIGRPRKVRGVRKRSAVRSARHRIDIPPLSPGPIGRLYGSTGDPSSRTRIVVALLSILPLALLAAFCDVARYAIAAVVAYEATNYIARSRRSGSFDLLLLCDETDKALAIEILMTHIRRSFVYLPVLFLSGAFGSIQYLSFLAESSNQHSLGEYLLIGGFYVLIHAIRAMAECAFYACTGCYAASFKGSAMGQAAVAALCTIGIKWGLSIVEAIPLILMNTVSGYNSNMLSGYNSWVPILCLFLLGALISGVYGGLTFLAGYLFVQSFKTQWRTGRLYAAV